MNWQIQSWPSPDVFEKGKPALPSDLVLLEDGTPILQEDGTYILTE